MSMTDMIRTDLKRDEGWRPSAYQDTNGYWTIGYGFLIDARKRGEIPKRVAEYWLDILIGDVIESVNRALPWVASQPADVQQALYEMAYNMGVDGLLGFKAMLAALKAGDRATAKREALDSRWAAQTGTRANRLANVIGGNA